MKWQVLKAGTSLENLGEPDWGQEDGGYSS